MKLNVFGFAFSGGVTFALCILALGLIAYYYNLGKQMVEMFGSIYVGFEATVGGSFVGGLWAFADAFIFLLIFGFIYNSFVRGTR